MYLPPPRVPSHREESFSWLSRSGVCPSSSGMAVKVMPNGLGPFLLLDLSEGVRAFLDIRPVLESKLLDEDDDCLDAAVA